MRFPNAQVIGYEHEWARGKLYLFGLLGIVVPGGLLDFLPELGPWRDRVSLPWLERREGKSMEPLWSTNIYWNKKQYSTLDKHAYTYTHKHGN